MKVLMDLFEFDLKIIIFSGVGNNDDVKYYVVFRFGSFGNASFRRVSLLLKVVDLDEIEF